MSPQTRRCVRRVVLKYWRWQGSRGTISNYDKVQCFIGQSGLPSHVLRGLDLKPTAKIKLQPPSMRSKARDIQRLECSMRLSSKCIILLYTNIAVEIAASN